MSTLTSAMYAGIAGLTCHSQAISVVGNNLANSNTIGYKSQVIQFQDIFYSTVNTSNGTDQVGHGASVSTIYNNFTQGSYEASTSVTDVAINGNGFFIVEDPVTGSSYYTRAGNFSFDDDGYLVNAQGYRVQGWSVDGDYSGTGISTIGSISDIQIENLQSPPSATSLVTMLVNLNADSEEKSTNETSPFFALQQEWDGTADTPIGDNSYTYQTTITVYDESGSSHDLTIYFDPVQDASVASSAGGNTVWEYIVTCDPADDGRVIDGQSLSTTSCAGLLMSGTITFDSSGQLAGLTSFTLGESASGDLHDLSNWTPADIGEDGYPLFTANFSGASNASCTSSSKAVNISLDFGIHDSSTPSSWSGAVSNASALGTTTARLFTFSDPVVDANATHSYDSSSSTISMTQNGYAPGYLESLEIDANGVISGCFSNGETTDLFVLGLADFDNYQGLVNEGGNLYSASAESGLPVTGLANTNGLGAIASNYLEQSNVDYSSEMVDLITYQRGYQANSKVITTVDSLLQEALNLKR